MHGSLARTALPEVLSRLRESPAVALLGPRQCGKTTLAKEIVGQVPGAVYLDLERPSDLRQMADPELFFRFRRRADGPTLFCLDEIQRAPELFAVLRSVLDEDGRNGQLLLLGSASRELIRQSSESLAGRISLLELTPFLSTEVMGSVPLAEYWLRGGFPRSLLAASTDASYRWRRDFIQTFLERDIPQLGFDIPAETLHRLWRMLAHLHGTLLNSSQLGRALGTSHTTVRKYLDLLTQTFMVRSLEPLEANLGKRLVRSPKVYLRDTGLLHGLLEIRDEADLLAHPIRGESWEGLVIENAIAAHTDWQPCFYRTTNGAEVDLVLTQGRRRLVIETKASTAPTLTRGFWSALDDLQPDEAWVIAPVEASYPLREKVWVHPLTRFSRGSTVPG
jgi:uncharacterized protein